MRDLGLAGVRHGERIRAPIAEPAAARAPHLVLRGFIPQAVLGLAELHVRSDLKWPGMVYVAFVIDAYSRRETGVAGRSSMKTALVLDALEQALSCGTGTAGLTCPGLSFTATPGRGADSTGRREHLDHGGSRWDAAGSSCRSRRRCGVGSGQRIGRCATDAFTWPAEPSRGGATGVLAADRWPG